MHYHCALEHVVVFHDLILAYRNRRLGIADVDESDYSRRGQALQSLNLFIGVACDYSPTLRDQNRSINLSDPTGRIKSLYPFSLQVAGVR